MTDAAFSSYSAKRAWIEHRFGSSDWAWHWPLSDRLIVRHKLSDAALDLGRIGPPQ